MKRFFLLLLPLFLITACDTTQQIVQPEQLDDGLISFKVLHINDVYEIAPLEGGKVGGMARVATIYNDLKSQGDPILFVHAGDFLNPSLLGNLKLDGSRIKGRQMVEVMNACHIDLVTFGNHEFDLDEEDLQARMDESDFTWLATNVQHVVDGELEPFYRIENGQRVESPENFVWEISDDDGTTIKVGIFSSTIGSNPKDYVHYDDPYQSAADMAMNLSAECEIVLGLTHLELVQDLKLAGMVPYVPLLMGGHDHDQTMETNLGTYVCKADANAKSVFIYQFTYNTRSEEWTVKPIPFAVTDEIEEDPEVAALVAKWISIQDEVIGEVIDDPYLIVYRASTPLDGRESSIRNMQTNMGEVINKAMEQAAVKPVDATFFNSGSVRIDDQVAGDITAVDIFRILPFGGSMVEADMTGEMLIRILDAGKENKGTGGYLQLNGMEETGGKWHIQGQPIAPGSTYHIAFTDFLLTGFETRLDFMTPDNPGYIILNRPNPEDENDVRNDIRKVVIDYLLRR